MVTHYSIYSNQTFYTWISCRVLKRKILCLETGPQGEQFIPASDHLYRDHTLYSDKSACLTLMPMSCSSSTGVRGRCLESMQTVSLRFFVLSSIFFLWAYEYVSAIIQCFPTFRSPRHLCFPSISLYFVVLWFKDGWLSFSIKWIKLIQALPIILKRKFDFFKSVKFYSPNSACMTKNATPVKGHFSGLEKQARMWGPMFYIPHVNLPASLEWVYSLHIVTYSPMFDKYASKPYFSYYFSGLKSGSCEKEKTCLQ